MKVRSSETKLSHPRFDVIEQRVEREDGSEVERIFVSPGDAVVICAVRGIAQRQELALVSQPREPIGADQILELPAGMIDEGEAPLPAAQRELAEEIGMSAGQWTDLGELHSAPGYSSETLRVFYATELAPDTTGAQPDDDEQIELSWRSLADARALIAELTDAKSVAAIAKLLGHLGSRAPQQR